MDRDLGGGGTFWSTTAMRSHAERGSEISKTYRYRDLGTVAIPFKIN